MAVARFVFKNYSLVGVRAFSVFPRTLGKPSSHLYDLPAPRDGQRQLQNAILEKYKSQVFYQYDSLSKISDTSTDLPYVQLPDDSQFITQHYKELKLFKEYLTGKYNKTFGDFSSSELLAELFSFINSALESNNIFIEGKANNQTLQVDHIYIIIGDEKISTKYFIRFLLDVKITLNLNSNHTFILDTLLQNKEIFDLVDDKITNKHK